MKQKPITKWDDVPLFFDAALAARLYGLDRNVLYKKCLAGEIPAFKIGKLWRFEKASVRSDVERKVKGNPSIYVKESAP